MALKQHHITGIILAGGQSTRMGVNKAWLSVENKRFIEYSIALLKPYCHILLISANTDEYNIFGYEVVPDRYRGVGPLGGLEACLNHSKTEGNFVLPCDVPAISAEILECVLNQIDGADAVVPMWNKNNIEPLLGYYSKRIHPKVVDQLKNGEYGVKQLLNRIYTRYVSLPDVKLWNINSSADYWEFIQQTQPANQKVLMPSLIVVSGTGKKVGKTRLACDIIAYLSKMAPVVAVKISNHFHAIEPAQKHIVLTEQYMVIEEQLQSNKDSSRMKQAGALRSYYIQAKDDCIFEAFQYVLQRLAPGEVVVCESNGLARFIRPALHFLVCGHWPLEPEVVQLFPHAIPVKFSEEGCSFDVTCIEVGQSSIVRLKN